MRQKVIIGVFGSVLESVEIQKRPVHSTGLFHRLGSVLATDA